MLRLATRKSPLALVQTELVVALLREARGWEVEVKKLLTTGDQQAQWSLEKKGGKGLFTKELEEALLTHEADLAVHSAKDLPGEMPEGLCIAGYLPRAEARDMLVRQAVVEKPCLLATGSPRRRLQLLKKYPEMQFTEIRGNVDTRLRKIGQDKVAEATVLAMAGLARLGIHVWPELAFEPLPLEQVVPAVGQAAIAVQCRREDQERYQGLFDAATQRALQVERALQTALGGGCHTAFAAHVVDRSLYLFHEKTGMLRLELPQEVEKEPDPWARALLVDLGVLPPAAK